jgi:hypothetical protein
MSSGRDRLTDEFSEERETCIDRVDLAAALVRTFAEPVLDYTPEFLHLGHRLSQYQVKPPFRLTDR